MNPNSTPEQSHSTFTPEEVQRRGMDKVADPQSDAAGRSAGLPALGHGHGHGHESESTDGPLTAKEASSQSRIRLPHERDEDTAMTGAKDGSNTPSPRMEQAAEDLAQGRRDTSRSVETDQAYHRLHESESEAPRVPPPQPSPKGGGSQPPGSGTR